MANVERLRPYSNSKSSSGSRKFKVNCQEKIAKETPTTKEWLELLSQFSHSSDDYKIFEALLENRKHVVVKIGVSENLLGEYDRSKVLAILKLKTFISFYCVFTCFDKWSTLETQRKYLCNNEIDNDKISVLVMPFFKDGQIDRYKWTRTNIHVFKSVLKHVICSLLYAFENCCFVHCDMHFGNILLKKTSIEFIQYGDRKTLPVLGMIPIIMDFERSTILNDNTNCSVVYTDISRVMNLARSEIDVKLNINNNLVVQYIRNGVSITNDTYKELCNYIDTLDIDFVASEMMFKWP
jgi:hypothetical protein